MQIFNTMTRKKEDFIPQEPGVYRIYVCGPTVYNYIHIGNARPMIVFDTLRRYLEYLGNKVLYVSNITDIDDKLIKKGQENGTTILMWQIVGALLCGLGPIFAMNIIINNTNAMATAYNTRLGARA